MTTIPFDGSSALADRSSAHADSSASVARVDTGLTHLEAMGEDTSTMRDTGALVGSAFKGMVDKVRGEKPSKNARDGYVTEQVEIAAYELLQRLAERAGDTETAEIARTNLKDERATAEKIAGNWDKVIDLTVAEEGITA